MLSKAKIHAIHALRRKKVRSEQQLFIAEGDKIVRELLTSRLRIEAIYALPAWIEQQASDLKRYTEQVTAVTEAELKQISALSEPNQVLAVAQQRRTVLSQENITKNFNLYLDSIQDPGNMGTILRIADWFGIAHIFCSELCVDVWNPKVVQAGMGALGRVNVTEMPFDFFKKQYPRLPVYGAVLNGKDIFSEKCFEKKGIIVIGNEGNGISESILRQIDYPITIRGGGNAESLNAAIATGIICAVACR